MQNETIVDFALRHAPPKKPRRRVARPPIHKPTRHRPTHIRLAAYLREIFRRGVGSYEIKFDTLARRLDVSQRSVERAVARLQLGEEFVWKTIRVGRSFAVVVSDRQPLNKGVFFASRKKMEIPRRCAPGFDSTSSPVAAARANDGARHRFAAWLARHPLVGAHWDNIKVRWRFAHAFSFALDALARGCEQSAIIEAYVAALHQRHKDATDADLNGGRRRIVWEPSSTVSLARAELGLSPHRTVSRITRGNPEVTSRRRSRRCSPPRYGNNLSRLLATAEAGRRFRPAAIDVGGEFLGAA